jgi:pimeloyl-ACP methyl ester carboxylesterase
MQTMNVNGYDMAYLDLGQSAGNGPPLVCVHGSLCDFRIWSSVLGPLTRKHRVIAPSLRHFFPDHWDGVGDTYSTAQHVDDVIGLYREARYQAGRPDGPFPRREYLLSRRSKAA